MINVFFQQWKNDPRTSAHLFRGDVVKFGTTESCTPSGDPEVITVMDEKAISLLIASENGIWLNKDPTWKSRG